MPNITLEEFLRRVIVKNYRGKVFAVSELMTVVKKKRPLATPTRSKVNGIIQQVSKRHDGWVRFVEHKSISDKQPSQTANFYTVPEDVPLDIHTQP